MRILEKISRGLQIIGRLNSNNDTFCAEHDEVWAYGLTREQLSVEDLKELEELGWEWDEDNDGWHHFV